MDNKQRQCQLLGLATRARLLISGEETVLASIRDRRIALVVLGSDASANTLKKFQDKCAHYDIALDVSLTSAEISQAIGKLRTVCAFVDTGFANSFLKNK